MQQKILSLLKSRYTLWGLVIALAILCLFLTRQSAHRQRLFESQKTIDSIRADNFANNIKIWRDKYNVEHLKVEQHSLERKVFNSYVDSTAKLLKVRSNQIQNLTQLNTNLQLILEGFQKDSTIVYVPVRDSSGKVIDSTPVVKQINFKWDKGLPWMYVEGSIGEKDSIKITAKDSIKVVNHWDRSWFLGRKRYYTDVSNSNPFVKITGARTVQPTIVEPKWILAPSMTFGLRDRSPIALPGLSLIYYPLSIKIK